MWYRAGADVVVVIHLLFIGFVVGGVFLAWRWPPIVWAHIPAVAYGALVELAGFICPLTLLENDLRQRAGQPGYRGGFIAHYLVKVIYPPGLTRGMQTGLGVVVLLVAIVGYRGFLRRHPAGRAWREHWPGGRPAGARCAAANPAAHWTGRPRSGARAVARPDRRSHLVSLGDRGRGHHRGSAARQGLGKVPGDLTNRAAQVSPLGQVELQELVVYRRDLQSGAGHVGRLGWAGVGGHR